MTKTCEDCGTVNYNGATRCKGCGVKFISDWWDKKESELNDRL